MPKAVRENVLGKNRYDPMERVDGSPSPLSPEHNKPLKREINDTLISKVLKDDNVVALIHNWLRTIRGRYTTTRGIPLISIEQLKNDLVKGLMLLNSDLQNVKASPILSEGELEGLDVTPELGKFNQLKKDEWMNSYIKGDISKWLLNDEIIYALQETGSTRYHKTEVMDDVSQEDDLFVDIGTLYGEYIGKDYDPIDVKINIGKLRGGRARMLEIFSQINSGTKAGISRALSMLVNIGVVIPMKVLGHTLKISTDIVLTTLLSIVKEGKMTSMFYNVLYGLFGPRFNISEDPASVREGLDTKYKVLLAQAFQKTLFTLSRIVDPTPIDPTNINDKIDVGLRVLNEYVTGGWLDFAENKVEITNVMFSLDKLIEWYLMRRSIVVYNPKSNTLLLEDVPLQRSGVLSTGVDVEMGMEPESEPESVRRKKKTKKSKKTKKTKKSKKSKKSKKRKKRKKTKRKRK
jgi:hypothetical protein